jgi:ATP-dependent RNA helicase DOB1
MQARRVAKIGQECKLPVNPEEYVEHFRPGLMEVVHRWAGGAKFIEICRLTDVFEGSVIRSMRRLEELLRQLSTAARSIGNGELESKFGESITLIKRDIIFAASLYLA